MATLLQPPRPAFLSRSCPLLHVPASVLAAIGTFATRYLFPTNDYQIMHIWRLNSAQLRTALRTSTLTGRLISWGWKHYLSALAEAAPDDCAAIPKVPGAGGIFTDETGRRVQLMHNGVKVLVDSYYDDLNTKLIVRLRGHHEPQEELVFHRVLGALPADITMIELGSYWAYYSIWAQAEKSTVRSILVEPVDRHMAIGKMNVALNRMNAEFVRAYVGASSAPPHTVHLDGAACMDVDRLTLDDLFARCAIDFAHIVHADVQGAEVDLLHGAGTALRDGRIGYIFLSTHSGPLHREALALLQASGFVILAEHSKAESYSTDGLIVARARTFPGIDPIQISRKSSQGDLLIMLRYLRGQFRKRSRAMPA